MFLIALLTSIKEKYGYADFIKKFFFTKALKRDKNSLSKHRVFYYLDILKLYSPNIDYKTSPELNLSERMKLWADDFLKNNALEDKILIGINPSATYGMAKCWPIDRYINLIKLINKNFKNIYFLLFGGKDNVEYNKNIISDNVINLTGKLSLEKSGALISKCKIFITNDTGPMHIADALDIDIVAIFGPTDPEETPPFRKREHIIYKKIHCSPCKKRICPLNHHQCMINISVNDVYSIIKKILEDKYVQT
jgi:heptosyltransferase-2